MAYLVYYVFLRDARVEWVHGVVLTEEELRFHGDVLPVSAVRRVAYVRFHSTVGVPGTFVALDLEVPTATGSELRTRIYWATGTSDPLAVVNHIRRLKGWRPQEGLVDVLWRSWKQTMGRRYAPRRRPPRNPFYEFWAKWLRPPPRRRPGVPGGPGF